MADFDFSQAGIEYEEVSKTEAGRKWESKCHPLLYDEGWVRLGKVKGVFAKNYLRNYDWIQNFKTREDDVWVCSFPKCGTTWTQEMVYLIKTNLDFDAAKVGLYFRSPYFEITANWSPSLRLNKAFRSPNDGPATFDKTESPRFFKTHLHYSLLPNELQSDQGPKMIYVARNPKDACLSWYHFLKMIEGYQGTLEDFVDAFVTDNVFAAPFWGHVKEYWEVRNRKNVLFITYEDMKKDLPSVIAITASFLGKQLTDEQMGKLVKHLSFESMKNNPSVNHEDIVTKFKQIHGSTHDSHFMRKGKVGSHKEEMTKEMQEKLDKWIEKNKIVDFRYD